MPATSARISRHCSRRAGHRPARQSAPLTWTFGNSCEDADTRRARCTMKPWLNVSEAAEYAGCEPRHDLHGMRAGGAAKRARQRKTRHSNSAGMDRCLAGTTRAGRSRSPAHRRHAERSGVMNPRATTERDQTRRARTDRTRGRRACWGCQSPRCARGGTEGRGRVSCGSGGRFGTCRPTWRTSFGRAQLTRRRFPRQMMIRRLGELPL